MQNWMIQQIHNDVQMQSPYDTGALRFGGISDVMQTTINTSKFSVGGQNAPYGVLLNDKAFIRGHRNKHYKWVENIIDKSVAELRQSISKDIII